LALAFNNVYKTLNRRHLPERRLNSGKEQGRKRAGLLHADARNMYILWKYCQEKFLIYALLFSNLRYYEESANRASLSRAALITAIICAV
jgi:hypothetical protein